MRSRDFSARYRNYQDRFRACRHVREGDRVNGVSGCYVPTLPSRSLCGRGAEVLAEEEDDDEHSHWYDDQRRRQRGTYLRRIAAHGHGTTPETQDFTHEAKVSKCPQSKVIRV